VIQEPILSPETVRSEPRRCLDESGRPVGPPDGYPPPAPAEMISLYRHLVVGRRFDRQASALVRQGRMGVFPSSHGQEACQVGAVTPLRADDWLFPTYRDSVALLTRGIDPVEVLAPPRGYQHVGYDPRAHRTAPMCTPLATHALHAVGFAHAARLRGDDVVALALLGDGATSEGDFHEALNFAGVQRCPVVFLVQNNHYAISTPVSAQTAAPTLAHKALAHGLPGWRVDGNDVLAVSAVVAEALDLARRDGPVLVEALTYRLDPHTNADDPRRYREAQEEDDWRARDPIARLEAHLTATGHLAAADVARISAEADGLAADVRRRMWSDPVVDPDILFDHVFATPTAQLGDQQRLVRGELPEAPGGHP
jgi:2-oxoisovalerate dehydrogenase E1 component alpha subunit